MDILNLFFAISGGINGSVAILLGAIVLLINRKIISNRIFFLFVFSVAFWSFSYWQWLLSENIQSAAIWIKLFTFGSLFIPVFYFHWIISIIESGKIEKYIRNFLYAITAVFSAFLFFSDLLIKDIKAKLIFSYWPVPGILYDFFIVIFISVIVYSFYLLVKNYFSAVDPVKKRQIFFLGIGSIIGFGGGITNFFPWYNVPILPYGNILVSFGLFFWAYAALKYKLFDISIITTEFLVFFIWIAILFRLLIGDNTLKEKILDGSLFIFVVAFGILLIRSVLREIKQRDEIQNLSNYKSELLSIVAHQIKNPLVVMRDYSFLISDGIIIDKAKIQEVLLKIQNSANKLLDLLNNLLDFGRMEDGKMSYNFEKIELNKLLKDIEDDFIFMASQKKLEFKFEPSEEEIFVKGDIYKLTQVFRNLIDNAIKYTKQGFINVKFLINPEGNVLIEVSDSGIGISKKMFVDIFKKFVRGGDEKEILGSGLGLYICKEIVENHNGKIWAESDGLAKGSVFYVKLPLYK